MLKNVLKGLALLALLAMAGCTYMNRVQLTLVSAPINPRQTFDLPPLPPTDLANWAQSREALKADLEKYVYGTLPKSGSATLVEVLPVSSEAFGARGTAEQWHVRVQADGDAKDFMALLVLPHSDAPVPLIMMQTFCGLQSTAPELTMTLLNTTSPMCEGGGFVMENVIPYVFGRYAGRPPFEMILDNGFGVLTFFSGDYIADAADPALAQLADMFPQEQAGASPLGAIGAWSWANMRLMDLVVADARIKADEVYTYGHSRQGKAALVTAAFDERFAGAVSHQSGTGGAALNRSPNGESVAAITQSYPHWFTPIYATYAGREADMPIDQHFLIALVAPRKLLLGNARRDVWSDPVSTYRAAQAATPAWVMYGEKGLIAANLNDWQPQADIAFWMRPGTHGQVEEDWPAFLQFLQAHRAN